MNLISLVTPLLSGAPLKSACGGDPVQCREVSQSAVCRLEVASDITMTRLLLGMGLRRFSMQPAQILAIKQVVLRADTTKLAA